MKLGLSMIVKNEEAVIRRCLESVKPFISYWVIADTGSTDRTKEVIRETMQGIPGEIIDVPWQGWGPTRSLPLALCRPHVDYVLGLIDADEVLEVTEPGAFERMTESAYLLWRSMGTTEWVRGSIFKSTVEWRFEGTGDLHELEVDPLGNHCGGKPLAGVVIRNLGEERLNANVSPVEQIERYRREAERLAEVLANDPTDTRAMFYLAGSLKDSLQTNKAIDAYLARARTPGGFQEERYVSLVWAANLMIHPLGWEPDKWQPLFLEAYEMRPSRAEALFWLGRNLRMRKSFAMAELFLRQAVATPRPEDDRLFIHSWVYQWWAKDELAITLIWRGKHAEAAMLLAELLKLNLPDQRERQEAAYNDCIRALGLEKPLGDIAAKIAASGKSVEDWLAERTAKPAPAIPDLEPPAPPAPSVTEAPPGYTEQHDALAVQGSQRESLETALSPLLRLNLGCGSALLNGYRNVDLRMPADDIVDLRMPWPWQDDSVDEIVATDVFQYLPDLVLTMNEAFRVLRPGGVMRITTPDAASQAADPKAVTKIAALSYFERNHKHHLASARTYGITAAFEVEDHQAEGSWDKFGVKATLRKPISP